MAVKLTNIGKAKLWIDGFLPGLLIAGPYSLLVGAVKVSEHHHASASLTGGTIMLVLGLILLKIKQDGIEKRLDELERLKN